MGYEVKLNMTDVIFDPINVSDSNNQNGIGIDITVSLQNQVIEIIDSKARIISVEHVNTGNVIDNDQHKENYDKRTKRK